MSAEITHLLGLPLKHVKSDISDLGTTDLQITKTNPMFRLRDNDLNINFDLMLESSTGFGALRHQAQRKLQIADNFVGFDVKAIPNSDLTYDLGTPLKKWKDLFLSDYIHLGLKAELPAPTATYHRCLVVKSGGAGVADELYVCLKQADGSYAWIKIV